MTKTVLQIVQHLKPGGIETMALDLQQHLGNCHVHIVSLEGTKTQALRNWPRLKTRKEQLHFLNKKPGFSLTTVFKLMGLMKKLKVDAVHTHHIGPLTYGGTAARLCRIKHLVHTEHDAWHLENTRAAKLEGRLLRHLKPELVADCMLVAQKLQKLTKTAVPYVIYNGIDTQRFCPATQHEKVNARRHFSLPQGVPLVGCAARLEEVKGISYLIAAMSYMPENTYLAIAGEGSFMERLQRQASFNHCENRILFLGRLEQMDLFYKAIDVFCLPSLNEGFPLSPLEAQACNVPAVITDVGGAKETLCPKTGSLIQPYNAHELKTALEKKLFCINKSSSSDFVKSRADIRLMTTAYAKLLEV
ncbi:glycosyltransferase [Terasakiella sp. SH-1]|uniref:glycosyltransferase n=1 Tax=Terasakiella sp. SH-1 TaxID=2560057 RepID=UPI0014321F7E|nr:glycosyltransferase [Terasakiella sp. SH-1]